MDFLNTSFSQLSDLFRSMTVGARITAALLLAILVVSLGYLFNHQMAGGDEYLLGGHAFAAAELQAAQAALSQAGLRYELEGTQIRIARAQQSAAVAALADAQALPVNWGDSLQRAIEADSPFSVGREREERMKVAKQHNLSLMLRKMQGVANAYVHYDNKKGNGFGPQPEATASVGIQLMGGRNLDDERVEAIRHFVAGACLGLSPERVEVVDITNGRRYVSTRGDRNSSGRDHPYLRTVEEWGKSIEDRVLKALSYVPGITVTANVELDSELHRSTEQVTHDNKVAPLRVVDQSTVIRSEQAGPAGPPGLASNTAQANTSARVGDSGKGSYSEEEQTSREEENAVNRDRTVSENVGLTPNRVTVAVAIPGSYFKKTWHERNPPAAGQPAQEPDRARLDTFAAEQIAEIRKHVAAVIPKPPGDMIELTPLVTVTAFQDMAPEAVAPPGTMERASGWFAQHWSTLGILGLVLVSLGMLRSLVRGAPSDARPLELPLPQVEDERDEQPEGAAGNSAEPPAARLKRRVNSGTSLRDELVGIVREDPDAAANILRSWIGNVG